MIRPRATPKMRPRCGRGRAHQGNGRLHNCHHFHDAGDLGTAPDLTGYGSREWMIGMISDPEHERFYGEKNDRMPAFASGGQSRAISPERE